MYIMLIPTGKKKFLCEIKSGGSYISKVLRVSKFVLISKQPGLNMGVGNVHLWVPNTVSEEFWIY